MSEDDAWIAGIADGAPSAFTKMVDEFASSLRRFAFRYTRSRELAAEVVQDVFYKMWRNRGSIAVFAGRPQLRSYLYRATRNQALDSLAREDTRARVDGKTDDQTVEPLHVAPADVHLELADLVELIEHVLAEMPERRRDVCALRWRHGLSVAEIAARLGIAVKTAEVQIGRGLRQLRERLARVR